MWRVEASSLEPYRRSTDARLWPPQWIPLSGTPTEVARRDYLASFEGERFAESMRYVRAYPEQLLVLRDLAHDRDAGADHQRRERSKCSQSGHPRI
jgi:hypothetical protein